MADINRLRHRQRFRSGSRRNWLCCEGSRRPKSTEVEIESHRRYAFQFLFLRNTPQDWGWMLVGCLQLIGAPGGPHNPGEQA